MSATDCNRHGWTEPDQDWDNACVCGLDAGHEGLHECCSGCGGTWAGGISEEAFKLSSSESGARNV